MNAPAVSLTRNRGQYYVPNITSESALFVGHFERGPIDIPIFITNVTDFKFIFGRSTRDNFNDWYQVYNFLQYASGIWVTRSSGAGRNNATSTSEVINIDKFSDWEIQQNTINFTDVLFIARTPGTWGNILSIGIISYKQYIENVTIGFNIKAQEAFSFFEEDNFGVVIFRENTIVETFYKTANSLSDINKESIYVYIKIDKNLLITDNLGTINSSIDFKEFDGVLSLGDLNNLNNIETNGSILEVAHGSINLGTLDDVRGVSIDNFLRYDSNLINLSGGTHSAPTIDDLRTSYSIFENIDLYDIDIIIGNERDNNLAVELGEIRKDCIVFLGFPTEIAEYLKLLQGTQKPINALTSDGYILALSDFKLPSTIDPVVISAIDDYLLTIKESTYVHFTMNMKVQLDVFSKNHILINVAGDTAGLKSAASKIKPWGIGAGLEKGKILNLTNMYMNISIENKTRFFKKGLNMIENGFLMSQKSYMTKPTKYNKTYIRSLFNHIRKEVLLVLRDATFEENTLLARQSLATQLKLYLKGIKTEGGIENARISIYPDNKIIVVVIQIKPKFVSEFIELKITNTGQTRLSDHIG